MDWIWIAGAVWLVLAAAAAVLLGRMIRLADREDGKAAPSRPAAPEHRAPRPVAPTCDGNSGPRAPVPPVRAALCWSSVVPSPVRHRAGKRGR